MRKFLLRVSWHFFLDWKGLLAHPFSFNRCAGAGGANDRRRERAGQYGGQAKGGLFSPFLSFGRWKPGKDRTAVNCFQKWRFMNLPWILFFQGKKVSEGHTAGGMPWETFQPTNPQPIIKKKRVGDLDYFSAIDMLRGCRRPRERSAHEILDESNVRSMRKCPSTSAWFCLWGHSSLFNSLFRSYCPNVLK